MTTISQRSFSSGEITPEIYSKVNFEAYLSGLKACRNAFVRRHGGLQNRSGTEFIAELPSALDVRMIDFVYGSARYVLIFTTSSLHFAKDGALVYEATKTVSGATNASPGVFTATSHGYAVGDWVKLSGIGGMTEVNGRDFIVNTVPTANTFTLKSMNNTVLDTTSFGTFSSNGTAARAYGLSLPTGMGDADVIKEMTYAQQGNVVYIAHRDFEPAKLTRTSDTSWAFSNPDPLAAAAEDSGYVPSSIDNTGTVGFAGDWWVITVVDRRTGVETKPSGNTQSNDYATSGAPITVFWDGSSDVDYNVYKLERSSNRYGYIGTTSELEFIDNGIEPDMTIGPPPSLAEFPWIIDDTEPVYPGAVGFYAQRLGFAGTESEPNVSWFSSIGEYENFNLPRTIGDADPITFGIVGRTDVDVRHILDLGRLIELTTEAEMSCDQPDQPFTPTTVATKAQSYNGSSYRRPLYVDNSAIYVQERGPVVRDLAYEFNSNGYRGNELSIFSSHLVEGFDLVDWTYQKTPNSIIWIVRDDGVMVGFTYVKEQNVIAWHRHDFPGGLAKAVCSIPDTTENELYVVVERTIDGVARRFLEKLSIRTVSEEERKDMKFLDAHLSYDGRNTSATTMTLSQGTAWGAEDLHTLTASASYFSATDVGNVIQLTDPDTEEELRFTIMAYTSATVVTGYPHKTTPEGLRGVAVTEWAEAVDVISGLWHLEGEDVSIFADGTVVASPFNSSYSTYTVEDGSITLPRPFGVVHVGLPYISDVETLDIDSVQVQGLVAEMKNIGEVKVQLDKTLGLFVGGEEPSGDDYLENLYELKLREFENPEQLTQLFTGAKKITIRPEWNSNGRVFLRQVDPVPFSILSIHADGLIPFAGGGA